MDPQLHRLISGYQAAVARRFTQLRTELGIESSQSNVEWACNGLKQTGQLSDGAKYFKHGYGCAVSGNSDTVDFDFGEAGEIDGFDSWRLWGFAKASTNDYGFASEKDVEVAIKSAASKGLLRISGDILYYLAK